VEVQYGVAGDANLAPLVSDLEREIRNKINQKQHQALAIPTILFLDFSAVGLAWLRTSGVWSGSLERLLAEPGADPYAGLGLMINSVEFLSPNTMAMAVRPEFDDDLVARVRDAFGCSLIPEAAIEALRDDEVS
jgi:hypothetical protein